MTILMVQVLNCGWKVLRGLNGHQADFVKGPVH